MSDKMSQMSIPENLRRIEEQIQRACELAGRPRSSVTLICVSKTISVDLIAEAYNCGIRDFGESRWQELQTKVHLLPSDIRWHFIGKVQSNKAKNIAEHCFAIHTIEKESQLVEIAKQSLTIEGFLQVNLAKEQQKSGIFTEALDNTIDIVLKFKSVRLAGLMTIGPLITDSESNRLLFRELAALAREKGLDSVSMGMSGDFEVAIQEGSTHIRVGSAIFGDRA